jgi:hypothetical protein
LAQRLVVWLMVGGVAGFGAVFLTVPGLVLGLVILAVLVGSHRHRGDLVREGGYLFGFGLVGWSLVGPAVRGTGGFLFVSGWMLVYLYAGLALAGAALVAYQAAGELRRQR